ncbi:MAG: diguanylate cyclase (GGDEF)-like protein [Halioglobus sp.]|jgi:diguanylate cyclase (GGDEF)-like protein
MLTTVAIPAVSRLMQLFISDRLLQDSLVDSRQRAPILVAMLAISSVSALSLTVMLSQLYFSSGSQLFMLATLMAGITLLGYLGTLWYFKQKQALLSAVNLYATTTTFSTLAPCMITGGLSSSPYFPLVLVVPTFIFLIAGRKYGFYWSLIAASCVLAIYLLELNGVVFPQIIPEANMAFFSLSVWLMALMLLVFGLISYEVSFEGLTNRIIAERTQFAHEAMHDPLTGLSNRKLFYARAEEAVNFAHSNEHKAAVIFIDLDDFKSVNDGHGHEAGDEVLNAVAQRLVENVRSVDTVARLGGDEFAVVLHGIERVELANTVVEKLRLALEEPLQVGEITLSTSGSMGVAISPDEGLDIDSLVKKADEAMYREKAIRKTFDGSEDEPLSA